MDLLDLLTQRNNTLTPRLDQIDKEAAKRELNFDDGELDQVDIDSLSDLPKQQANVVSGLLGPDTQIEFGRAKTSNEAGWYEVQFDNTFDQIPVVIPIPEHREGDMEEREYEPPEHDSPGFEESSERPEFEDFLEEQFKEQSREMGRNAFQEIKDAYESILPTIAGIDLSDPFVSASDQILQATMGAGSTDSGSEGVIESIFGFLGETVGASMEEGFAEKASELESALNFQVDIGFGRLNSNVNSSYEQITRQAENSLNRSQKLLYDTMGMPEGALINSSNMRNIDQNGFEILGLEGGMTVHYIAVGPGSGRSIGDILG